MSALILIFISLANLINVDKEIILEGEVANPASPPTGCYFHPRCSYATEQCRVEEPELTGISSNRQVRCHRATELSLTGVV